jgi:protein required for attachment to host cells
MQIPSELRAYEKPTLIVVTNTMKAKLFLAKEREVEEISVIDVTKDLEDESSGREKLIASGAGGNELSDKKDHITKDHFYHALNEDLMRRLQNNEFEALAFTVPAELENELKECLNVQLLKKAIAFVPKNLMNDDLVDIITVVQEIPEE